MDILIMLLYFIVMLNLLLQYGTSKPHLWNGTSEINSTILLCHQLFILFVWFIVKEHCKSPEEFGRNIHISAIKTEDTFLVGGVRKITIWSNNTYFW